MLRVPSRITFLICTTCLVWQVRSVEELAALPERDRRLLHAGKASFEFGVAHAAQLQALPC